MVARSDVAGFWARTSRQPNGCLLWLGARSGGRYGATWWDGRQTAAHRLAFFLTHGRWPDRQARHTCDTPTCVEPTHILEGTHRDNIADRVERNRSARGEGHGRAKLTVAQVLLIRERLNAGERSQAIAMDYGVSSTAIRLIGRRLNWRWVA